MNSVRLTRIGDPEIDGERARARRISCFFLSTRSAASSAPAFSSAVLCERSSTFFAGDRFRIGNGTTDMVVDRGDAVSRALAFPSALSERSKFRALAACSEAANSARLCLIGGSGLAVFFTKTSASDRNSLFASTVFCGGGGGGGGG